MLSPRGYDPLYALMIFSHRALRYCSPLLHLIVLGTSIALIGRGRSMSPRWRFSHRAARGAPGARRPCPSDARRALLRADHRVAGCRVCGTGLCTGRRRGGSRRRARGDPSSAGPVIALPSALLSAPLVAVLALLIRLDLPGPPVHADAGGAPRRAIPDLQAANDGVRGGIHRCGSGDRSG